MCGPDNLYLWSSYSHFSAKASLNSGTLDVKGGKYIKFHDGVIIKHNNICD